MRYRTEILRERIRVLASAGMYADAIAKKVGRSVLTVQFHAREMGVNIKRKPAPGRKPNYSRRRKIKAMLADGMSQAEIARTLGVTQQVVYGYLKRMDMLPRKKVVAPDARMVNIRDESAKRTVELVARRANWVPQKKPSLFRRIAGIFS